MKSLFALALVSSVSLAAFGTAIPADSGLQSETVYECADASGRVEVEIRNQRGHWTEGSGDQTSYVFQRYLTSVKVDGKAATMLSASCRGSWRARAALCSAQSGDTRYDFFRGVNFPLQLSAIVWVGNRSASLPIVCRLVSTTEPLPTPLPKPQGL